MKKPSPSSILRKASVKEGVAKASHSAGFVVRDLQPTLKHATGAEAIVILGIIDAATELKRRIDQLDAVLEPEATSIAKQRASRQPTREYQVGDHVKHDTHGTIILRQPILKSGNWYANPVGSRRKVIVGENRFLVSPK